MRLLSRERKQESLECVPHSKGIKKGVLIISDLPGKQQRRGGGLNSSVDHSGRHYSRVELTFCSLNSHGWGGGRGMEGLFFLGGDSGERTKES